MTFDELRAAHPSLGFAIYALEAGEDVTLECYHDEQVFSFKASTAQAAIDLAFPPAPPVNVFD